MDGCSTFLISSIEDCFVYWAYTMNAERGKADRTRGANSVLECQTGPFFLLALPVAVLHQVLDLLRPDEQLQLLQISRAMAQEVMQHSAGRLTLKLELYHGVQSPAIRQVLQWAPPSTLKLWLYADQPDNRPYGEWSIARRLFPVQGSAIPAPSDQSVQHMQHYPCILSICLQCFNLPGFVPAGLASMCPNMRTLHLLDCVLSSSSQCSDPVVGCTEHQMVRAIRQLASAMAQQPAGRCIRLVRTDGYPYRTSKQLAEVVLQDAEEELAGVIVKDEAAAWAREACLSITTKQRT